MDTSIYDYNIILVIRGVGQIRTQEKEMTLKEILSRLELIEGELDDATNTLPDWDGNTDSRGYIDGAKCELYHLKDDIERMILDQKKDEDILYNRKSS